MISSTFIIVFLTSLFSVITRSYSSPLDTITNLTPRSADTCVTLCGTEPQFCCAAGQYCGANSLNQAYCAVGGTLFTTFPTSTTVVFTTKAGNFAPVTSTTLTVSSSFYVSTTTTISNAVFAQNNGACNKALGQNACGSMCCPSTQYCDNGQCVPFVGE
jgi:hypothetical protein